MRRIADEKNSRMDMNRSIDDEVKQVFMYFDRDSSGQIDKRELKSALVAFGADMSDSLVESIMRK